MKAAVTGAPLGRVSVVPGGSDAVGEGKATASVLVDAPERTVDVACPTTGVSLVSIAGSVGTGGVSLGVDAKIAVWVKFGVGKVNGVGEAAPSTEHAFSTSPRVSRNISQIDFCRFINSTLPLVYKHSWAFYTTKGRWQVNAVMSTSYPSAGRHKHLSV
jgi:hypothetical protein